MRMRGTWIPLSFLMAAVLGCSSTEEKSYFKEINADLSELQTELKDGIFQIETVTSSLDSLAGTQGDLRQPFSAFNESIANLETVTARVRTINESLKAEEASFQKGWSEDIKEIDSKVIRQSAEKGRADVEASFKKLEHDGEALGIEYREWEAKVKSIQSNLSADLSLDALQALAGDITGVLTDAEQVKEGLRQLTVELGALSESINASRI